MMEKSQINIDFEIIRKAFPEYVREKAKLAGSNIVYIENNQLIKEDPSTSQKTILISSLK